MINLRGLRMRFGTNLICNGRLCFGKIWRQRDKIYLKFESKFSGKTGSNLIAQGKFDSQIDVPANLTQKEPNSATPELVLLMSCHPILKRLH